MLLLLLPFLLEKHTNKNKNKFPSSHSTHAETCMRKVDYANAIRIYGVVPATMAMMMMSHWMNQLDNGNTKITTASTIADPIRDVIAIVPKILANCARNLKRTYPNKM